MDTQMLINVLTWALITAGTGLLTSVVWFARRIVNQLDRLEELFQNEVHGLDRRILLLEAWREGFPRAFRGQSETE